MAQHGRARTSLPRVGRPHRCNASRPRGIGRHPSRRRRSASSSLGCPSRPLRAHRCPRARRGRPQRAGQSDVPRSALVAASARRAIPSLSVPDVRDQRSSVREVIAGLRDEVLDTALAPLTDAVSRYSVSRQIAWGTWRSAVHGAAAMLNRSDPSSAERARAIVDGITAHPPLAATGTQTEAGFRRRSCCLLYRIGPERTAVCGDCVLLP